MYWSVLDLLIPIVWHFGSLAFGLRLVNEVGIAAFAQVYEHIER